MDRPRDLPAHRVIPLPNGRLASVHFDPPTFEPTATDEDWKAILETVYADVRAKGITILPGDG